MRQMRDFIEDFGWKKKGGRKEIQIGLGAMAYIAIGPAPSSCWGNGHMTVAQRPGGAKWSIVQKQ